MACRHSCLTSYGILRSLWLQFMAKREKMMEEDSKVN